MKWREEGADQCGIPLTWGKNYLLYVYDYLLRIIVCEKNH